MSMAKMFISGLKDPIMVTDEQGRKVNKMLDDITIPEERRVNVGDGKWIGVKKLIKYVIFDQEDNRYSQQKRIFTADQVSKFRKEMKEHLNGRPQTKRLLWEFYEKKGAIKVHVMMSKVPGIGEVVDMGIINFAAYQYLDDLKDHVASLDRRADFERAEDNSLDEKYEATVEKMTFKL